MMSKKGVESFPFFLFLSLLVAAIVITIGFYQVSAFSEFSSKREIMQSYERIINTMKNLRETTDIGSFARVHITIPKRYKLTFYAENDTISISGPGINLSNQPDIDIINVTDAFGEIKANYTLQPGDYNLVIYYGYPQETKPLEVFFK
ncbi:MAG: hypothetical protein J7K73_01870 [Nanoarchaeota archaeon]|nr:hypothetical protein [Nanoarchaeota archaeon]